MSPAALAALVSALVAICPSAQVRGDSLPDALGGAQGVGHRGEAARISPSWPSSRYRCSDSSGSARRQHQQAPHPHYYPKHSRAPRPGRGLVRMQEMLIPAPSPRVPPHVPRAPFWRRKDDLAGRRDARSWTPVNSLRPPPYRAGHSWVALARRASDNPCRGHRRGQAKDVI
jgi:hypothetical protein